MTGCVGSTGTVSPSLGEEYPREPQNQRILHLPGGAEPGRMERAEGLGDFRGKWTESRGFQLGAGNWRKQITGEKIEVTGNTQRLGGQWGTWAAWGLGTWGRKLFHWLRWTQPTEGLEVGRPERQADSEQMTRINTGVARQGRGTVAAQLDQRGMARKGTCWSPGTAEGCRKCEQ